MEHLDVVIVGAGLSGIGMAWHLQDRCPGKTYAILEAREASGGTWDLFRYPGIRSDSDMQTMGYRFKPWTGAKALADGDVDPRLRARDRRRGGDRRAHPLRAHASCARSGRRPTRAGPSTSRAASRSAAACCWCAAATTATTRATRRAFEGREDFAGEIVHPQFWPEDLDYAGKRVVVIGSGATAVTLVPALAQLGRRARDDAPALAVLRALAARRGPDRATRCGGGSATAAATRSRAGRTSSSRRCSSSSASASRARCAGSTARARCASCRPATRSTPTSTRATSPGTSACASCPTATCSRRSRPAAPRSSPPRSTASPSAASRLRDGAELEADVIITATGPEPARCSAASSSPSTARRSSCRGRWPTSR